MRPVHRTLNAFVVAAGLTIASGAFAQSASPDLSPSCEFPYGMCGYVDQDDRTVIEPRFEWAGRFRAGLAPVSIDGRFGYIDTGGSFVIPAHFDRVGEFYMGHAAAQSGELMGAIDAQGNWIVAPAFLRVIPFTRDVLLVQDYTPQQRHLAGRGGLSTPAFNGTGHGNWGTWGLYHVSGQWVLQPDLHDLRYFESDGRGLIWAKSRMDGSDLWGLIAADGTWITEPRYSSVTRLVSDRATVAIPQPTDPQTERPRGRQERWRWGAVDETGQLVIPLEYERLYSFGFADDLARFRQNGKAGFMDRSGAIVIPAIYNDVSQDHRGRLYVVINGQRVGIDRDGNVVDHPQHGEVYRTCPSGLSLVNHHGKFQFVGPDGNPTTETVFDAALGWFRCDRPSTVQLGERWSFVDTEGHLMFDPPPFENRPGFDHGVAAVKLDGKWGLIDEQGRFVVEPQFDLLVKDETSHYRLHRAEIDGRRFWIDEHGIEISPQEWLDRQSSFPCGHGFHIFRQGRGWGMIDASGSVVVPARFDALTCFRHGYAWAAVPERREWCQINRRGEISTRHECRCGQPLVIYEFRGGPDGQDCYARDFAEAWDGYRAAFDR